MTTTKIVLQEDNILKLVLEFLCNRKLYKAARILEKETTVVNCPYGYSDSITFIRELVLDGEWEALEEYSQPLSDIHDFDCRKFCFLVTKQKYLEILIEKCEGNVKDEQGLRDKLVYCLKLLEKYCSDKDEYNKLYWYLSVPSLREEPEFLGWNIDLSRMVLFEEVLALLKPFIPLEEHSSNNGFVFGDRLLGLISKGLLYENCIEFCQKQATHKTHDSDFSLRDIRTDIFRVQPPERTGNFYSWLHSLTPENFLVPFEELDISVSVEKQRHNTSRPDMRNNFLTKSLTLESRVAAKNVYRGHAQVETAQGRHTSDSQQRRHLSHGEVNGREVSQSWADFTFVTTNNKRTPVTHSSNTGSKGGYLDSNSPRRQNDGDFLVIHSKKITEKNHGSYNLPIGMTEDDHSGMMVKPKNTHMTNSNDGYSDNKLSPKAYQHDNTGLVVHPKNTTMTKNYDVYVDNKPPSPNLYHNDHTGMVMHSKNTIVTKNHDDYHVNRLPPEVYHNDHSGMVMHPKNMTMTKPNEDYLDNKSPRNLYQNEHTGIVMHSKNANIPDKHEPPPGRLQNHNTGIVVKSPRKTKQTQQELVLKRLEEHKKKQQELHQQLAEMTVSLANEGIKEHPNESEWLDNSNSVVSGEITNKKSLEALKKSKESLSFLTQSPSTTPTGCPQRISTTEENHVESERLKSTGSEPKTPINKCIPPGLVQLTDGSGTFNTSTPKSQRQPYMTPPPPASPVALEQKPAMDETPLRYSQQKKVVAKDLEGKPTMRNLNQTPKRATPGNKQSVVRTLVNDTSQQHKKTDETFAIKRKDTVNTASKDIKFQKVAVLADTQAIRSVAFHPNGKYFAVGTNSKSLKVCSFQNLQMNQHHSDHDVPQQPEVVFQKTPVHKGSVYCVAFSPRGNMIATGSNDKLIKLICFGQDGVDNLQNETELAIHSATVRDLVFINNISSPPLLASGGAGGGLVYISDCTTSQTISSLQGHSGNIMTLFAGSHDNLLCSGSADKSVRLWDLRTPQCIDVVHSNSCVASVCFNYGTGPIHLASAHENGQCVIYDIAARKTLSTFNPHTMDCRTIRYSPDSRYLLTGSYDASIVLTAVQHDSNSDLLYSHTVAKHKDKVIQCRWHPSVYTFLSTSADKTVALWEMERR